ncbi:MAG: nuclear transport factor 2 family protein [Acidobacteriota bacterium]|nr:nuclear transport factor 2 family protein [Acidobacteriota bacterium]
MKTRKLAVATIVAILVCSVAQAQNPGADSEAEAVRQAVRSYLENTTNNENAAQPVPSSVVHPRAKVFSVTGDDLQISNMSNERPKRKGKPVKIESISEVVTMNVTGSMAVAQVERTYPYGSLTAEEYKALPENHPLKASAGKPIRLTSYLSLLKIGGTWKIVSFLIPADVKGDK